MAKPTSQYFNDCLKLSEKFLKYSFPFFDKVLRYIMINIINNTNSNKTVYIRYYFSDNDFKLILNILNIIELKHNSNNIIPMLLKIFLILFFMLPPLIL